MFGAKFTVVDKIKQFFGLNVQFNVANIFIFIYLFIVWGQAKASSKTYEKSLSLSLNLKNVPWKRKNFPFLVLLVCPPILLVPQLRRSSDQLRVNCWAVGEAGAVHIKEKLALQSQCIPTHVPSANAASRSIRVSSGQTVRCNIKKMRHTCRSNWCHERNSRLCCHILGPPWNSWQCWLEIHATIHAKSWSRSEQK